MDHDLSAQQEWLMERRDLLYQAVLRMFGDGLPLHEIQRVEQEARSLDSYLDTWRPEDVD